MIVAPGSGCDLHSTPGSLLRRPWRAGTAINVAFRLLEAAPLKRALGRSAGALAVIASRWFFEEVVRHLPTSVPATYRQVQVSVKETQDSAWIRLPDDPYPIDEDSMAPASTATAPHQLPAAHAGFVGREAELQALTALLDLMRPAFSGQLLNG